LKNTLTIAVISTLLLAAGFTTHGAAQQNPFQESLPPKRPGKVHFDNPFRIDAQVGLPRGEPRLMIPPTEMLAHRIGLTEDQLDQVESIRADFQASVEPLLEESHQFREALYEALRSENPSPAYVGDLVISTHVVGEDVGEIVRVFRSDFESILTVEQLERLKHFEEAASPRGRFHFGQSARRRTSDVNPS
jgi:Spy/CpxP family protein refolding chaperone